LSRGRSPLRKPGAGVTPLERLAEVPTRAGIIRRLAAQLSRAEYPRTLMIGFVGIGCTVGFLTSAGMLAMGFAAPWVRYSFAAFGGYIAFLVSVRLWLAWRRGDGSLDVNLDGLGDPSGSAGSGEGAHEFGGGDGFSGGGSSGSFGNPDHALHVVGEADEGVVFLAPLLVAVALLVGIGATFSVLWNAPALLAEVVLDGVIAGAIYRRLRLRSAEHWSAGVVRRTWKPMLAITVALVALGVAIPLLVPGADSIGDLFR
jgi:hypothetical protein